MSPSLPGMPSPRARRRDRRGRGLRGRLVPPTVSIGGRDVAVPLAQSRSEQFDDLVLDAVEHLEERWGRQLEGVEFAVEDVPAVSEGDGQYDDDVVADETAGGAVPLGRLLPATVDDSGAAVPARVVVYRRPLEARSRDSLDLADLVHDVVVDQVARLLGLDPDDVDPPSG